VLRRHGDQLAGGVHQHVDPAPGSFDRFDGRVDGCLVGHVEREAERGRVVGTQFFRQLSGFLGRAAGDRDLCALLGELFADHCTEPAVTADDQDVHERAP